MSERRWTPSQLEAISFQGKNLILSAAAGSGKTATLTERIIRLLKDPESGADISRMLIVTFTTAAAGELKSRIADALNRAIADDPKNPFLTRQLASLEGAHISTIDSFFKSEIKPYFSLLNIAPDFSILDEAEAEILRADAVSETVRGFFEGKYTEVSKEEFCDLADCLSNARNENDLKEALLSISQDMLSYDIGEKELLKNADELLSGQDFMKTSYAQPLIDYIKDLSEYFFHRFAFLSERLSENEATEKYTCGATDLSNWAKGLYELFADCAPTYVQVKEYLSSFEMGRLSALKAELQTDDYIDYKGLRSDFSAKIKTLVADSFSADTASLHIAMEKTAYLTKSLSRVLSVYFENYTELKREKGALDFADLSKYALKLFVNEDDTPTNEALEVSKKYDYVFIDEYQDTNKIQDRIFSAVSYYSKRFMVGDEKQSIYGFRGSRPEFFSMYREMFSRDPEKGHAIFMQENFRSDSSVIDLSNKVSEYMFYKMDTTFEERDRLVCSKIGGDSDNICEVILCKTNNEEGEPLPSEAEYTARRISEMLSGETLSSGEPIRPGDIAILLRSGTKADDFVRALAALGIPANNSATENFFSYGEVLLVLCLLSAADNPLRDIYLAGAMKSPLFGFTLNDLVNMRESTEVPLWYSLVSYCEGGQDTALREKCIEFKNTVDRWRSYAREFYCDEVLRLIVSDTGLRTYSGDGVRTNKDVIRSLKILSEHAARVAKRGGGLHELILHLNSVIEKKDSSKTFKDPDSVTILTIHRSKGLEYPVCFVCDTQKRFNESDSRDKFLMDRQGRVAMKLYDKGGLVRCDTPLRASLIYGIKRMNVNEEARVLYVALTRARERLIITCRHKDPMERLSEGSKKGEYFRNPYTLLSTPSYLDWIIDGLQASGSGESFIYKNAEDISTVKIRKIEKEKKKTDELSDFFEKSLDFSYDKEYLWNIPAKLTVSALKPDILGQSSEERTYIDTPYTVYMEKEAPLPAFLTGEKKADSAERGTATHIFMQFCDYDALMKNGAEAELSRLVEKRFISKEDAALVRLSEIELFRESEIFKRLLSCREIMRERRFNTLLPAWDFTTDAALKEKLRNDGTQLTVQGVVDCIFTDENGKCVLLDYKTDRLTREELENEDLARQKLLSRHSRQLLLYRKICRQMLGKDIDEVYIYSLPLGKTIDVTPLEV